MEIDTLKKDIGLIRSALKVMPDRSVVATKRLKVCFPKGFEKGNLAEITDTVRTIMMLGVIVDKSYCFLGGIGRITLHPGDIYEETIKNDRYFILEFEPGETVIESLTIPQDSNIGYSYYVEFTKYARIPWYCTEEDILAVYDESEFYTGKSMGSSNQAVRVLYSLVNRSRSNLDIPFRYSPELNDITQRPRVIGINNPGQLLNSTFSRLASGYMNDNINAGLLNPDTKVTQLEEVIRGLPAGIGEENG